MPTKTTKPARDWPEGGELFAKLAKQAVPTLTDRELHALAVLLLDSPVTPTDAATWEPDSRRRDLRSILVQETTLAALIVQAWSDRAHWALLQAPDAQSLHNYKIAVRVLKSAVDYLGGNQ